MVLQLTHAQEELVTLGWNYYVLRYILHSNRRYVAHKVDMRRLI